MSDNVIAPFKDPQTVIAVIVHDVFRPSESSHVERMPWVPNQTLSQFLGDLSFNPVVTVDGVAVDEADWGKTYVPNGSTVTVMIPPADGGQSGDRKSTMRMVVMIAAMAAGQAWVAQLGLEGAGAAVFMAAYMTATSLLVNKLMPIPKPKTPGQSDESATYSGIDGPKNTSQSGLAIPICYGKHRMAGNIVGYSIAYTNSGSMLSVGQVAATNRILINAGEGRIAGLSDIKLDDESIKNIRAVRYQWRDGSSSQPVIDWFNDVENLITRNIVLNGPYDETIYTTTQAVDGVTVEFTMPLGQYHVKKDGSTEGTTIDFQIEIRKVGDTVWKSGITLAPVNYSTGAGNAADIVPTLVLDTSASVHRFVPRALESIPSGNFQRLKHADSPTGAGEYGQVINTADSSVIGFYGPDPKSALTVDENDEEFQEPYIGLDDATLAGQAVAYNHLDLGKVLVKRNTTPGSSVVETNKVHFYIHSQTTLKAVYRSPTLPRGNYEVKITRLTDATDSTYIRDATITGVVERQLNQGLSYPHSALLAVEFQPYASKQFQSIPNITFLNHGVMIRAWNDSLNNWETKASSNPAWVYLDMMTNTRYGAKRPDSEIDLVALREWATFCDDNELEFNGVFDVSQESVWDAMQKVLRVGRASPTMNGGKYSVTIYKAKPPVQLFNNSNIIEGSLSSQWGNRNERVNTVEFTFNDKLDDYKPRTIRLYDTNVLSANIPERVESVELVGITNEEQAYKEATLALNLNRSIQTVNFRAFLDAIACTVGDVVLVQHDMPSWGQGGRIVSGTTTTAVLDRPVTIEAGKTYKLLVRHDQATVYTNTVSAVDTARGRITINGKSSLPTIDWERFSHLTIGANTYKIVSAWAPDATHTSFDITPTGVWPSVGNTANVIIADYVQERTVSTGAGTHTNLTVSSAFSTAPSKYAVWGFGEVNKTPKPYMILGIQGDVESLERTITAMEYSDTLFSDTLSDAIPNYSGLPVEYTLNYPTNLQFRQSTVRNGVGYRYFVNMTWTFSYISTILKTVKVYAQIIGEPAPPTVIGSGLNNVTFEVRPNKKYRFFAVPVDINNEELPITGAPYIDVTTGTAQSPVPEQPINLTVNLDESGNPYLQWAPGAGDPSFFTYEVYRSVRSIVDGGSDPLFTDPSVELIASVPNVFYKDLGAGSNRKAWYWVKAVDLIDSSIKSTPAPNGSAATGVLAVTPPTRLIYNPDFEIYAANDATLRKPLGWKADNLRRGTVVESSSTTPYTGIRSSFLSLEGIVIAGGGGSSHFSDGNLSFNVANWSGIYEESLHSAVAGDIRYAVNYKMGKATSSGGWNFTTSVDLQAKFRIRVDGYDSSNALVTSFYSEEIPHVVDGSGWKEHSVVVPKTANIVYHRIHFQLKMNSGYTTDLAGVAPMLLLDNVSTEIVPSSSGSSQQERSSFFAGFDLADDYSLFTITGPADQVTIVSDSTAFSGGKVLQIGDNSGNDEVMLVGKTNLQPLDRVYRLEARYKRVSGSGKISFGVQGYAADGVTPVDPSGGNTLTPHWFCANEYLPASGTWVQTISWNYSTATPGDSLTTGSASTHDTRMPEVATPVTWSKYRKLHANVKYIRPVMKFNTSGVAGKYLLDYLRIENYSPSYTEATSEGREGAAAAQAAADAAQSDAAAALAELTDISSDNKLSTGEKKYLVREYADITGEQAGIGAQADAFSITTEKTNYYNAISALTSYLTALNPAWNSSTSSTPITRSSFNQKWSDVYNTRQILLNKIAAEAALRANWTNIAARPSDDELLNAYAPDDTNILSDPTFQYTSDNGFGTTKHWDQNGSGAVIDATGSEDGDPALKLTANGTNRTVLSSKFSPAKRLQAFKIYARIYVSSDFNGTMWLGATQYGKTKNVLSGTPTLSFSGGTLTKGAWADYSGTITTTAVNLRFVKSLISIRSSATAGYILVDFMYFGRSEIGSTLGGTWGTDIFSRPTELIDGRIPAGFNSSGDILRPLSTTIANLSNLYRRTGGGIFTGDDNATYGARAGLNLQDNSGATLNDEDVLSNYADANVLTVLNPRGATLSGASSNTGAIKIRLPQSWTSTMMRFIVDVYVYSTGKSFTVEIGGYNHSSSSQWVNTYARILGDSTTEYTVRFGHDGTKCCVWIGEVGANWTYPKVTVRNFQAGFTNFNSSQWATGWAISFATSFGTITATHTTTLPGSNWTLNSARPVELTDGRIPAGFNSSGDVIRPITDTVIGVSNLLGSFEQEGGLRVGTQQVGGIFSESFDDPNSADNWEELNGGTAEKTRVSISDGKAGGYALRLGNNSGNDMAWIAHKRLLPFDQSRLYRFRVRVRRTLGTGTFYCGFVGVAANGTTLVNVSGASSASSQHYIVAAGNAPGTSWVEYVGYLRGTGGSPGWVHADAFSPATAHANVRYIRPMIIANYSGVAGTYEIDYFEIEDAVASAGVQSVGSEGYAIAVGIGAVEGTNDQEFRSIAPGDGIEMDLNTAGDTIVVKAKTTEADHIMLHSDRSYSSTTLTDVTDFGFLLEANTVYEFEGTLIVQSAATSTGLKLGMTVPAGATVTGSFTHMTTSTESETRPLGASSTGFPVANSNYAVEFRAIVITSSTAGAAVLRAATEVTSSAVTLKAYSLLKLHKCTKVTPSINLTLQNLGCGSTYGSSDVQTSGVATAVIRLNINSNGTWTITDNSGSVSGSPVSGNWGTPTTGGAGVDYEVQFIVSNPTGTGTVGNPAANYIDISTTRTLSFSNTSTGGERSGTRDVTVNIRKKGTTAPIATDTLTLTTLAEAGVI